MHTIFTKVLLFAASFGVSLSAHAAFTPVISEFMVSNDTVIKDEDDSSSDWIEIFNSGDSGGNLEGWCLTDSDDDLAKWIFPYTPLPPGAYILVFASGKDRRISGRELHTNFKLGANGEYLALVRPDRTTVVSEYSPEYPGQLTDISYGLTMAAATATYVTSNSPCSILVPSDSSLGADWTHTGFTPGAEWDSGSAAIGFDTGSSPATGLAAHWPLDEQTGTSEIGDVSGGGHHGVATAGVTMGGSGATNSTATSAAFYNASIDVPYSDVLNPPGFTITAWVRPATASGYYRSVITSRLSSSGRYEGYILYLDPSNRWQFWTGDSGGWRVLDGPAAVMTEWTHIAITFGAATQTKSIYINGQPYISSGTQGYTPNSSQDLHIGGGGDTGTQYRFNGDIDDVVLFNTVLDSASIRQVMAESVPESGVIDYNSIITTDIESSMHEINSSVYLRIPFTVDTTDNLSTLKLRAKYDDGFIAYLNGTPVATRNGPLLPQYNSSATFRNHDAGAILFEEIDISGYLNSLQTGQNVLAIHGLNFNSSNEDFLFIPELTASTPPLLDPAMAGYFIEPTPGEENAIASSTIGPLIDAAGHSPAEPMAGSAVTVTATVSQTFFPIGSVTLHYRAMYNSEISLNMSDDGTGGDLSAGDGIYSATIPAGTAAAGEMLRYYITAMDTQTTTMRAPRIVDTEGSAQSPEYYGTRVQNPAVSSQLPIFYWWTQNVSASHTRAGTRCCVFYNGEFYDNVFVRQRGGYTNGNSQKFVFDKSHRLYVNTRLGRVREINMNAQGVDASFIRQTLAFQLFAESGTPASESFLTLMRVNGGNDRVGVLVEQVDDEFLDRNGLDEFSALYKCVQKSNLNPCLSEQPDGIEKKIPANNTDFSDLQDLIDGLALSDPAERKAFLFDNFNVPEITSYLAVRAIIQDIDDIRKNFYICRDTHDSGEWRVFPWDKDYTFGIWGDASTYAEHPFLGDFDHKKTNASQWSMLLEMFYNQPETLEMFRRRTRTLMDSYLLPPGTPAGTSWLDQRASSLFAPAGPHLGSTATSSYNGVLSFLETKRVNLYVTHHESNLPADVAGIPDTQPKDLDVQFGNCEISPSSGNQNEEYVEIVNTNSIAIDISGWTIEGGIEFRFAPGTVIPAHDSLYISPSLQAFRGRTAAPTGGQGLFVVGAYSGHLSELGENIELRNTQRRLVDTLSYNGLPSAAQSALRITEIMYNPRKAADDTPQRDFEFIELTNTGESPIDLNGVHFSEGIEFTFTGGTLFPGEVVAVVRTPAVFATRYNTNGLFVAGPYNGSLADGGEQITLKDALEQNIASFAYSDGRGWPLAADGAGHSLVPAVDGGIKGELLGHSGNWRAGTYRDGSPGKDDPQPVNSVVINEIAAHTDYSHPARPEYDSNDWLELFNQTSGAIPLNNWYLSDDPHDLRKWAIPLATSLPAGGWIVFDEVSGFHSPITSGFGLSKAGEQVYLSYMPGTAEDRVADAIRFEAQENGVTLSRYTDGAAYWFATAPTPWASNQRPLPEVVISRIMYNPAPRPGSTENNTEDEYIEIFNATDAPIELWNASGQWRVSGTIDFIFPANTTLPSLARMTLVSFNPQNDQAAVTAFLDAHGMNSETVILAGPFEGSLDNSNGRISIERPLAPDSPEDPISWVTVDQVIYSGSPPWPQGADATGLPIERLQADKSGSAPENWRAGGALPSMTDIDLDGLPDIWETTWFGGIHISPYDNNDSDPHSNLEEYEAGTDPTNTTSFLKLDIGGEGNQRSVNIHAQAASGAGYDGLTRFYTLESTTNLISPVWHPLPGFVDVAGTGQLLSYTSLTNHTEFFRAKAWLE